MTSRTAGTRSGVALTRRFAASVRAVFLAALATFLNVGAGSAFATIAQDTHYRILDLDSLSFASVDNINTLGHVLGRSKSGGFQIWDGASITAIREGSYSYMNDLGQAVGSSTENGRTLNWLYSEGRVSKVTLPGAAAAIAIDNRGQLYSVDPVARASFVTSVATGTRALPSLCAFCTLTSVSRDGWVVAAGGYSVTEDLWAQGYSHETKQFDLNFHAAARVVKIDGSGGVEANSTKVLFDSHDRLQNQSEARDVQAFGSVGAGGRFAVAAYYANIFEPGDSHSYSTAFTLNPDGSVDTTRYGNSSANGLWFSNISDGGTVLYGNDVGGDIYLRYADDSGPFGYEVYQLFDSVLAATRIGPTWHVAIDYAHQMGPSGEIIGFAYDAEGGAANKLILLSPVAEVPEPASWLLMLTGIVALIRRIDRPITPRLSRKFGGRFDCTVPKL